MFNFQEKFSSAEIIASLNRMLIKEKFSSYSRMYLEFEFLAQGELARRGNNVDAWTSALRVGRGVIADADVLMFLLLLLSLSFIGRLRAGRWSSFPDPDFRKVIQISSQSGASSYREISHNLRVLPWLVRVYAQSSNGSNAGFAFEGLGSAQSESPRPRLLKCPPFCHLSASLVLDSVN